MLDVPGTPTPRIVPLICPTAPRAFVPIAPWTSRGASSRQASNLAPCPFPFLRAAMPGGGSSPPLGVWEQANAEEWLRLIFQSRRWHRQSGSIGHGIGISHRAARANGGPLNHQLSPSDVRQAQRGACSPQTRGDLRRARSPLLELQCAACAKLADSRLWKPSDLGCSVPCKQLIASRLPLLQERNKPQ
jgi:hypothetical protein